MIDSLQANDHKTKSWREIALMFFEKEGGINMCVDNQNGGINCRKRVIFATIYASAMLVFMLKNWYMHVVQYIYGSILL